MRIDGKDGLMKKIYTGKSLDELKALAISEIKELGVDEADIKITVVEELSLIHISEPTRPY